MAMPRRSQRGVTLPLALVSITVALALGAAVMSMARSSLQFATRQADDAIALELAAGGVEKALQDVQQGTVATNQLVDLSDRLLRPAVLSVETESIGTGWYRVTAIARLDKGSARVESYVNKYPKSKVFDYAYFLNNWAWYWGHNINVGGDSRGNGRFDLYQAPTVNGHIYARYEVDEHGYGITGLASDPSYRHAFAQRVEMPNLLDLSYYESLAQSKNSSLRVGTSYVTQGGATVSQDTILVGTSTDPIVLDGPVVFSGDVVIKGYVTGRGCIYAGRNVYVAGNIQYQNGPATPRPPNNGQDPATRDQWVYDNQGKDLVGFAARGSIIQGDYTGTTGGAWYSNQWLFSMGSEDVGLDGIPDTNDEGERDGVPQFPAEDLDGDGQFRASNYGWSDVQTARAISTFQKFGTSDSYSNYGQVATNNITTVSGICYTNHAYAARTGTGVQFNGSVISKDEAIIFRDNITFNYDERTHSRYSDDPNALIDLNLFPASPVPDLAYWHQPKLETGGGA